MATNKFEEINDIINLIILILSLLAVIIFIYKYKLKGIDTPALIISSTYLFKNVISFGIGGELYTLWDYI